jgi:hypothetical protein
VASTDFSDGYFHLLLANPIKGGNYICRIPAQHTHDACLHGGSGHQGEATVSVDMVEARFALLERENRELRQQLASNDAKLTNTTVQLSAVTSELTTLKHSTTGRLDKLEGKLCHYPCRCHCHHPCHHRHHQHHL